MSMLELDIAPGKSLGNFQLGMTISQVIFHIKILTNNNKTIKRADIKFSENELLEQDIVIDLSKNGVLFRFDPIYQRLKTIEIYNLGLITLRISGILINPFSQPATLFTIYNLFTYSLPGKYDIPNKLYHLHYPGISISFELPKNIESSQEQLNPGKIPFEVGGEHLLAKRILIYESSLNVNNPKQNQIVLKEPEYQPPYFILAEVGKGIEISGTKIRINFGTPSQSVLYELGSPSKIFYKKLQGPAFQSNNSNFEKIDFFFNYFDMGLDIMFDGETKLCKKFIFHTNYPNHYHFNRYAKCNFIITFPEGYVGQDVLNPIPVLNNENQEKKKEIIDDDDDFRINAIQDGMEHLINDSGQKVFCVKPETKWVDIRKRFGECGDPVVVSKAYKVFTTNFFAYKGAIFEVLENDYLATVCLFPY